MYPARAQGPTRAPPTEAPTRLPAFGQDHIFTALNYSPLTEIAPGVRSWLVVQIHLPHLQAFLTTQTKYGDRYLEQGLHLYTAAHGRLALDIFINMDEAATTTLNQCVRAVVNLRDIARAIQEESRHQDYQQMPQAQRLDNIDTITGLTAGHPNPGDGGGNREPNFSPNLLRPSRCTQLSKRFNTILCTNFTRFVYSN